MHFFPNARDALLIDGATLYSASRNLGFDVDYCRSIEAVSRKGGRIAVVSSIRTSPPTPADPFVEPLN